MSQCRKCGAHDDDPPRNPDFVGLAAWHEAWCPVVAPAGTKPCPNCFGNRFIHGRDLLANKCGVCAGSGIAPAGLPCVSPTERDDQDQTMRRNLSTPELRAYWQRVEAIAANSPIVRERLGVPEYVPSSDVQPARLSGL